MSSRVVLIDGSSLVFRAFFAIPSSFTTAAGLHTNAIYGFALMFRKIFAGKLPEYAAVVFDAPGPTFRDERFPEYKAHRPAMAPDLVEQLPWIDRVVQAHDFPMLRVPGVEADDVIGTLTRLALEAGHEVHIYSADKDFAQLIGDRVRMVDTMRDVTYDAELVRKKWGVPPSQMRDFLAIVGDSADNVPGVPGVGQKTVVDLLSKFGSLNEILDAGDALTGRAKKILEHRELALLSQELVTIEQHVPLDVGLDALALKDVDRHAVNALYRELEFNSLLTDAEQPGLDSIDTAPFTRVRSLDELEQLLDKLRAHTVALFPLLDPDAHILDRQIVGVALAVDALSEAWYVPLRAPDGALGDAALPLLGAYFADDAAVKVVHNLRDMLSVFTHLDLPLRGVAFDVQLASFLVDPTKIIPHELGQMAKEYLQATLKPLKQLTGSGASATPLDACDVDDAAAWACHVAAAIAALHEPVASRVAEEGHDDVLRDVSMPMAHVLSQMQLAGIRVDAGVLSELETEFAARRDAIAAEIFEAAGGDFNLNSPKQLGEVLFDTLKLPVLKRTKTGYSTAADVLERLAVDHDIPRAVLRWRGLEKLINTYTRVLAEAIHPATGRVHATFQQTTGATGRLITTNPDLQRTPVRGEDGSRIRGAFVARDGWVLISADWSQIELRMLAHFSEDPLLVDSFQRDLDLHRRTAAMLFDVEVDDVTAQQRVVGKTVNFATIYGQGATALGQQLGIPRKDAKAMIDRYFEAYADVRRWLDATIATAHERGYVETILGRRRYIPELKSNNFADRAYGERVAANTPIQGSAADLCKVAMLRIAEDLNARELTTVMMVQIHDELLLECAPEDVDATVELLRHHMQTCMQLKVPLIVDVGTGPSWAVAH